MMYGVKWLLLAMKSYKLQMLYYIIAMCLYVIIALFYQND